MARQCGEWPGPDLLLALAHIGRPEDIRFTLLDDPVIRDALRCREALERIAGPPDRPNLSYAGKVAARALDRQLASPEAIDERARRDYDHYLRGLM